MRFAKIVFRIAGIYGFIVLLPQYFTEDKTGRDFPPPITHPEFYYGFIGLALTWQLLFILLSTDPVQYRLMMIPSMFEKVVFVIPVAILHYQHHVSPVILGLSLVDLVLGVLFVIAYVKTAPAHEVT
ncbi:MAG TPA: hypothetical protein VIX17_19495 [Pyrinomonadaceae bacterium]|jgi:hypothetical protein